MDNAVDILDAPAVGADGQMIESVREFWDRRPCQIRHSDLEVGSREYFAAVERRRFFVEPHIATFAMFERWAGKRVLEIGCGLGTDAVHFARAGAEVTVVELSSKSLELCRRHFASQGLHATYVHGNAEELDALLPPQTFDLIYAMGVLHHTPHPERVLHVARRFMGPQSELRIMLYARWSWKVLAILARYGYRYGWNMNKAVPAHSEAQAGSPVTYVYSVRQARRLLESFNIIELRKDFIFPYRVGKYVKYQYERVWYFRVLPAPVFQWLERLLGWHLLIVAKRP